MLPAVEDDGRGDPRRRGGDRHPDAAGRMGGWTAVRPLALRALSPGSRILAQWSAECEVPTRCRHVAIRRWSPASHRALESFAPVDRNRALIWLPAQLPGWRPASTPSTPRVRHHWSRPCPCPAWPDVGQSPIDEPPHPVAGFPLGCGDPVRRRAAFRAQRVMSSSSGPVNWGARQEMASRTQEGRDDPEPTDEDRRGFEGGRVGRARRFTGPGANRRRRLRTCVAPTGSTRTLRASAFWSNPPPRGWRRRRWAAREALARRP
jgi:hypothetical protein